jgi:UDP-glucose 4-epimerase
VVRQLGERGERVVVLDNLGKGFRQAVVDADLVVGEVGDQALVSRLMAERQVDTVMHFAAHTIVPESVALPLKYYGNNTCSTRSLLQASIEHGVEHFVFSSTAAVYGIPEDGYAGEDSPTQPINAYGTSKLMSEWMLRDVAAVNPLRYVALRYFNVAGSDPGPHRSGNSRSHFAHQSGLRGDGRQAGHVSIFGTTTRPPMERAYATTCTSRIWPRPTCAPSIICAPKGRSVTLNVGYGHGYSVREVLAMVESVGGKPLVIREEARRAGDPAYLVARADRIRTELGWQPRYDDLEAIVTSSLAWEQKLLREPWS